MTANSHAQHDAPRLSIGMPVYNAATYLQGALDSLLGQTYTDFELIISDNASTDATSEICRRYAAHDSRIRYEQQSENRGANWNFNRVVELARGELFKWAAADDLCDRTFIERCVAVLDAESSVVMCHSLSVHIDGGGQRIDGDYNAAGSPTLAASAKAHRRFGDVLLNHGWGVRCSGVFRREPLLRTGLFQPYYGWEKVMMADLALVGRAHLIDQPLFFKRVHDQAMSHQVMQAGEAGRRSVIGAHYHNMRSLPRVQYVRGYLAVAWRRSQGWLTWARCMGWIAAYLFQMHKWHAIARRAGSRWWMRSKPDQAQRPRFAWTRGSAAP